MLAALIALVVTARLSDPCPVEQGGTPRLTFGVGTPKVLSVDPAATWRVNPPGLINVMVISKSGRKTQLLLTGLEEGDGVLIVESASGVTRWDLEVLKGGGADLELAEFKKYFPCGCTMRWKFVGDRVEISGTASSLAEWIGARRLQHDYPHTLIRGQLDPVAIAWTIGEANAALMRVGLTGLHFVRDGDAVLLEGEVPDGREKDFAKVEAEWREKLSAAMWKPRNRP